MYQKGNKEWEVVSLFRGDYTSRFYLREISRSAKMPLKTCQNALENLEKKRIIKSRTEGRNKYFFLNLENIRTKYYLLHSELLKTEQFMEKYPETMMFIKELGTKKPVIVFGSFAAFKAREHSDFDMLIIAKKEPPLPYHLLPREAHKIVMGERTFKKALEKREELIEEIKEKHVILTDHSFYVETMWEHYGKRKN